MSDVSVHSQNGSGEPLFFDLGCSLGGLDAGILKELKVILFTDQPDGTHEEVAETNNRLL
jgi:hypothetical protein